jgi:hypothetical protein
MQKVFLQIYTKPGDGGDPIPVKVLRAVIELCRRVRPSKATAGVELIPGWHQLERAEQEALLLVDVLGKSYPQTGLVLNKSKHEIAATVALGRYKLIASFHLESERDPQRKES